MENMWLVFEFGGNYKSAQIFSAASCGSPVFGILYFAYFFRSPASREIGVLDFLFCVILK